MTEQQHRDSKPTLPLWQLVTLSIYWFGIVIIWGGLNKIIDLCIPVYGQEGGTMVIPGHGRLSDVGDVINYREMVTIVRDRVQDMVKKKMTLEQVKAAKPTFDYDVLYGAKEGAVFVEQVYRSLSK